MENTPKTNSYSVIKMSMFQESIDRMVVRTRRSCKFQYLSLILIAAFAGAYYFSSLHSSILKPDITTITIKETETIFLYEDDSQYFPDTIPHFSKHMLGNVIEACFFESFIMEIGDKDSGLEKDSSFTDHLNPNDFTKTGGAEEKLDTPSLLIVLIEFADLMATLNVKAVFIEPSVIYCMLSPFYKQILLKRKVDPKTYFKSKQVLTFGIREKYIPILEKAHTQSLIRNANFSIEVVQEPSPEWMQTSENFTSHLFFKRGSITVHAVVFHKRGGYLWHGGIGNSNQNIPKKESLHFAEADSAYDSFVPARPGFAYKSLASVLIPSDPHHFLFQMPASKFLECNAEVVERFKHANNSDVKGIRSPLALHRFKMRMLAALGALKRKLTPLLMRFWIWSGTMLGWYRQCGVIPYTSDIDFGAWAVEVDDLNTILELFEEDDHLQLKERMGVVEEGLELHLDYYKLRVDLFFLYTESNGTYYAGHRPSKGYFFKYHHPDFSLCSADLLGHKVLVPCEAEKNIRMEYGPNWEQPISSYNYETSPPNRGPDIYWNESMRSQVYDAW